MLMLPNERMVTEIASVSSLRPERAVETGHIYNGGELEALHAHLVLQFRSMADKHRPGCAFVAPFPSTRDVSSNEILVIPARTGAALFTIGFHLGNGTTMVVRIGEHGVLTCSESDQATQSLAATAEFLFTVALGGRYREEIWTRTRSGRYEGGRSYFLDASKEWQELGPRPELPASSRLFRHRLTVRDRRYEPY